jgi:hypothetical protein
MVSTTVTKSLTIGTGQVTLQVSIGFAQIGVTSVYLGQKIIPLDPATQKFNIGSNLKGQTLTVITVVTDINQNTDQTQVTYDWSDGVSSQSFSSQVSVSQNGGMACYQCSIALL